MRPVARAPRSALALGAVGLLLVFATACGESKAEKANRAALAPIAQRQQAIMHDVVAWDTSTARNQDTWQNAFDRYDRFIADQEEVRKDLRAVVPASPTYGCVIALLNRASEEQLELLQSAKNWVTQSFQASVAVDRAADARREYWAAPSYIDGVYLRQMVDAGDDAQKAFKAAKEHRAAAEAHARTILGIQDTLNLAMAALEILPTMRQAEALVITEKGSDSAAVGLRLDSIQARKPSRRHVADLCAAASDGKGSAPAPKGGDSTNGPKGQHSDTTTPATPSTKTRPTSAASRA